ncbi:MAG: trypsin-like peptidase domain-containing protein, partial [Candidatus Latescibacteria bacterium]|nr:trypsin-like peptidase domain-containing protein [Candidatus Latescibacterota bacterium]
IATLGFPGELQNGGWAGISPVSNRDEIPPLIATFKDGTISALRPPSPLATVSSRSTYIVQYNFDMTGGTSGSPVYDTSGKVIAVNNCKYPYTDLDFGIRVDKANELLSGAAKQVPQPCGEKQHVIEILEGRDIRTLKWCEPSEVLENLE